VEELEQRVACKEMSRMVAEMLSEAGGVQVCCRTCLLYLISLTNFYSQTTSILDLPLTADARLSQTRNMSVDYYRAAMVAAR